MNTFGTKFRFTSFGESHGTAIGGIIDGCPAGVELDMSFIQDELDRRRPGQSAVSTARKEDDKVEFLSGIFEGKTTGSPIAFVIWNQNQHSADYEHLKDRFRPSHADFTYLQKYGIRDYRGGGRSSARETAGRVVAGAIAKQILVQQGIRITAYTSQIGPITLDNDYRKYDFSQIENNVVRCPDTEKAAQMTEFVEKMKKEGDSIGGTVTCVIEHVPAGVGNPIFGKLQATLASAIMSINAVKGFEYGCGFNYLDCPGSELNDVFCMENGQVSTRTNYSGGIQGGISNGQPIYFRVAFKPTPSISKTQQTVNMQGEETELSIHGRHDPCILPRAVPVVEAMTAIALLDCMMNG